MVFLNFVRFSISFSDKKGPPPISPKTKPAVTPEHKQNSTNGGSASLTGSLTGSLSTGSSGRRQQSVDSHMSTLERRAREEERRAAIRAAR